GPTFMTLLPGSGSPSGGVGFRSDDGVYPVPSVIMSRLIRGACVASERKYPRAKMPAIMTPAITRTNKMERIGEPLSGNSAGALRHIIRQARRLVIRRWFIFWRPKVY